jgi:spore germination protein YaaH
LVCACALLSVIALPSSGPADAATPTKYVSGWIPTWGIAAGTAPLATNAGIIGSVAPFAYTAVGPATFAGGAEPLIESIRAKVPAGIRVIPSITDGTAKGVMAAFLADPTTRTQHVNAIVSLVQVKGYDGIDLDYEGFAFVDGTASWPATKPNWVAFVNELGARFDEIGKTLSVTIPPVWANGSRGYTVYDPRAIIGAVDELRLMVYDYNVASAGPLAPMSWVNDVIATTRTLVGPENMYKVQIGVPTYGRNWVTARSGTCPANAQLGTVSVLQRNADALIATRGATPVRDVSGEMRFTYQVTFTGPLTAAIPVPVYTPPANTAGAIAPADASRLAPALRLTPPGSIVTCVVTRTVYYPDAETVAARAKAAIDAGTAGISIWALGFETAETWNRLRSLAP